MAVAPALLAQEAAQDAGLLPRIRAKMTDVLLRQPDYTCTETVERSQQTSGGRPRVSDTLRLEVALVDGKEMFAWPGSKQFEDRKLKDLVSTGMFGNGNFALYARILFLGNVASFEDRGEQALGGHPAWRYDFRVPRSAGSHWLRVNDREAAVGFHGSFYADPMTLDVRRLEVVAEDIPAELGVTASEISVDYGRLQIGDDTYLLPTESNIMMAMPDEVSRNSIRFAACRRFTGESTLLFTDPALTDASAPAEPVVETAISAGNILEFKLQDLDLMHAAVGDPVQATLLFDLKKQRKVLAPKGSIARGRIVRLDRYPDEFVLQIDFQDLDWLGGHAALKLSLDQTARALSADARPAGGVLRISRRSGQRLSDILMFWRTE